MKAKKLLAIALVFIILVNMFAFLPNYVQAESSLRLRLTGVYLRDYITTQGDTVAVNFMMLGDLSEVEATLQFYSKEANQSFSAKVEGLGTSNTYFLVPRDISIGEYEMMYINITENNQTVTFTTNTIQGSSMPFTNCLGQKYLTVTEYEGDYLDDTFINIIKNLSFKQENAKIGDEVKLNFTSQEEMDSMWFKFYNDTIDTVITVPVSNIKGSDAPYFATNGMGATKPFVEGLTYKLKSVSIWTDNYSTEYAYNLSDLGLKELTLTIKLLIM